MPISNSLRPVSARELRKLYGGKTRDEALQNFALKQREYISAFEQGMSELPGFVASDPGPFVAVSQDTKNGDEL